MILIGILCSLLATFPRPLMASLAYMRGLAMALVAAALLQFLLLPSVGDFEMLALFLTPLLYVIAVGLANPQTAGIGIGLGLSTFLLVGPQNQGAWINTSLQWFEFAGGYVSAGVLALLVYAWVFPFDADAACAASRGGPAPRCARCCCPNPARRAASCSRAAWWIAWQSCSGCCRRRVTASPASASSAAWRA